MPKDDLLAHLEEAHASLLVAADWVAAHGDAGSPGWGPREVLAHVAAWETEAMERIPLLARGAVGRAYDVDAFNASAVAAIGSRSFAQVCASLEQAHGRLITELDGLSPDAFAPDGIAHDWVTTLTSHSHEHARELDGAAGD